MNPRYVFSHISFLLSFVLSVLLLTRCIKLFAASYVAKRQMLWLKWIFCKPWTCFVWKYGMYMKSTINIMAYFSSCSVNFWLCNSGVTNFYKVAGHNLGLLIWLDGRDTIEDVCQKYRPQPTLPLGNICMSSQTTHICV